MTEAISQPHTPSSRKGPERTIRAGSRQGPRPPALRSIRTAQRAHSGRQTQGHAGQRPEPPRQGVTRMTRRGGPAAPLPRPVTQCPRPRPPPGMEQSARETVAGLGQGPRKRHVGGGGGDRAGATNKGTRARPGPTEPGRQGALRGAARGQCVRGPAGCTHLGPRAARPTRFPLRVLHPDPGASHLSATEAGHGAAVARSCAPPPAQPEPDGTSPPQLLAAAAARPAAATAHTHCARRTATDAPPRRLAPPDALRRRGEEAGPCGEGGAWRCSPGGWGAHPLLPLGSHGLGADPASRRRGAGSGRRTESSGRWYLLVLGRTASRNYPDSLS